MYPPQDVKFIALKTGESYLVCVGLWYLGFVVCMRLWWVLSKTLPGSPQLGGTPHETERTNPSLRKKIQNKILQESFMYSKIRILY